MGLDGAARLKIVSWNMAKSPAAWSALTFPQPLADVALLQEAIAPSDAIAIETVPGRDAPWVTSGGRRDFCAAVANLSGRARMSPLAAGSLPDAESGMLAVSRPGSLAAATIEVEGEPPITVVSLYAAWERSNDGKNIYADASAHRLISDLSALVGSQRGHRIIAAGDLNILNGYGEQGSAYWGKRYATVFARFEALGLPFVGPQHPHGLQADPWPDELPRDSKDVPTFRTRRSDPASATRQLDFVFASRALHGRLHVAALNAPEEWGPSDHCRVLIEFA
jgi:exonuclease III